MLTCTIHTVRDPVHIPPSHIEELKGEPPIEGGYSDIRCAKLKTHDPPRLIAIKCFRPGSEHTRAYILTSIQEELLAWRILSGGPNIVDLFGIITEFQQYSSWYVPPYPVSEYHNSGPLNSFVLNPSVTPLLRLQLLAGVIRGLTYIHSKSIIHNDLKACNVVVSSTADGHVPRICDFGSSCLNCSKCNRGTKYKAGTIQWISPELCDGEVGTAKSDIWAFGCVALEAQFGKLPYDVNHWKTTRMRMRGDPPATTKSIGCNLDSDPIGKSVWDVMQMCWQWDPTKRPDAQGVLKELDLALESHQAARGT